MWLLVWDYQLPRGQSCNPYGRSFGGLIAFHRATLLKPCVPLRSSFIWHKHLTLSVADSHMNKESMWTTSFGRRPSNAEDDARGIHSQSWRQYNESMPGGSHEFLQLVSSTQILPILYLQWLLYLCVLCDGSERFLKFLASVLSSHQGSIPIHSVAIFHGPLSVHPLMAYTDFEHALCRLIQLAEFPSYWESGPLTGRLVFWLCVQFPIFFGLSR